jgi:hypothetical protein
MIGLANIKNRLFFVVFVAKADNQPEIYVPARD